MPTDDELNVLETVVAVLGSVFYLTDALSGEKEVTASALRCILVHLKSVLGTSSTDNRITKNMKNTMLQDLNSRYSLPQISKVLDICSFLDPRFKSQHLEENESTLMSITEECLSIYPAEPAAVTGGTSTPTVAEVEPPQPKKLKGLSAILKRVEQQRRQNEPVEMTLEQRIQGEITSYQDYPVADSDANVLVWWKTEEKRFPTLSRLAKKYLCICGTSVPSERIFSTGGYIVNGRRSRLQPTNVNKLIFLSHNLS